jgi:O-antigen/teichoic acid export membrane protein
MSARGAVPGRAGEEAESAGPTRAVILRAVSWFAAGHAIRQAIGFGSLVILTILLSEESFGTIAAGLAIIGVPLLLLGAGTRGEVITAAVLDAQRLRRATFLNVAGGVPFAAAIALLAGPAIELFADGGDVGALRALAVCVPLYALSVVPLAVLQKQMRFREHAEVTTAATVLAAVASVVLAALGAGVWSLVARQIILQGVTALLAWIAARPLLRELSSAPRSPARANAPRLSLAGSAGFFALAVCEFVAYNGDYLIVGSAFDAERLGLYSVAFTLAFAPLRQISWQVGAVLFPATAATADLKLVGQRTLTGMRLLALGLWPAVPVAIVLAPLAIPGVLGDRWEPMVAPFQILLVVGSAHAVLNVLGESLSGTGHIDFRARVHLVWSVSILVGVYVLVQLDGLRGAALAHLLLFIPLGVVYVGAARRIGTEPTAVLAALRGVGVPVAVQGAVTAAAWALLRAARADALLAALGAASVGALVVGVLLLRDRSRPVQNARDLLRAAMGRA